MFFLLGAGAAPLEEECVRDEYSDRCLAPEEAVVAEELYNCEAACDGSCRRTPSGVVCFPEGVVNFTATAARMRTGPSSTSTPLKVLPAGTPVPTLGRKGAWVHTDGGWVHGSLLRSSWVAPPDPDGPVALRGWPVALHPKTQTLFEVVDRGNGGAVDGPWLQLCGTALSASAEPECFEPPQPPTRLPPSFTEHLNYLWNEHGLEIQRRLAGTVPVTLKPVANPLVKAKTSSGAAALRHGERIVWTSTQGETARVVGSHVLGDRLLVALRTEVAGDCCGEEVGRVLPLQRPESVEP